MESGLVDPTLESLVLADEYALTRLTRGDFEAPIGSVHLLETEATLRHLHGGELLLAPDGPWQPTDPESAVALAHRLADAGVAGLALRSVAPEERVREAFVEAANECGLGTVRVPPETPFVALSKEIEARLAGRARRDLHRMMDSQRELARSALPPAGPRGVVETLARTLDGWCVLLNHAGECRHAAPPTARRHVERLRMETGSLRAGGGKRLPLRIGDDSVGIYQLDAQRHTRNYLVVGTARPPTVLQRSLETIAVSLLSTDLATTSSIRAAERSLCSALLRLVLDDHYDIATLVADIAGLPIPEPPVRVAVLRTTRDKRRTLIDAFDDNPALTLASTLVAELEDGRIGVMLTAGEGDTDCIDLVVRGVAGARCGLSEATDLAGIGDAWATAEAALEAGDRLGWPLATPSAVARTRLIGQISSQPARAWSIAALSPLRVAATSDIDLVETLRAFLASNGRMDRAGNVLGVHRHTVRTRVRRIEDLLGRDLDDPALRAELWLALELAGDSDPDARGGR